MFLLPSIQIAIRFVVFVYFSFLGSTYAEKRTPDAILTFEQNEGKG